MLNPEDYNRVACSDCGTVIEGNDEYMILTTAWRGAILPVAALCLKCAVGRIESILGRIPLGRCS